jgi:integrase
MGRELHRLSARRIAKKQPRGQYCDGGGLYLQVSKWGTRSWSFRYGEKYMGLGPVHTVPLVKARKRAAECRDLLRDGIDPKVARDAKLSQVKLDQAHTISFRESAEKYVAAKRAGWKNAKHAEQWSNTLETYCGPVFGALPVSAVDSALVLKVLEPIWTSKPETASRLRARIEKVLDWAAGRKYRAGENPARWRGHLEHELAALNKKRRVKHHPALPYEEIGAFMERLRAQEGIAARALEFTILSAGRTGEVIGAKPGEFDLAKAVWTVPAERMKAGHEHRVPLSPRAVAIAKAQPEGEYVFSGMKEKQPLSNMAMLMLLERMKRDDLTVHGFRSSFRDWAAEQTNYPREVCEMALAHVVQGVEGDYRRGDLFEKRRRMMNEWARYCETPKRSATVTSIRKKKA